MKFRNLFDFIVEDTKKNGKEENNFFYVTSFYQLCNCDVMD